MAQTWDVFISHASEDKRAVVLPLAAELGRLGLRVWVDAGEIALGDSLQSTISEGLAGSRYGVVVLSPAFLGKHWPLQELRALMAIEAGGHKRLLPVLHGVSRAELRRKVPLLADRVSADFRDGPAVVATAIADAIGRVKPAAAAASCVVDFSHGQREWEHLSDFFEDPARFTRLERGLQEQSDMLDSATTLVVPPPFHQRLVRAEIELIERWVDAGKGLLLLGAYAERHHAMNVSELAWRFDLEFVDDVVQPAALDCNDRRHVFSRDPALGVAAVIEPGCAHPIVADVRSPVFVSAASVRQTTDAAPELVLHSPDSAHRGRPLGRILADGSRPNLDRLVDDGCGAVPLLVARRYGRGRVLVAGTWKLCTVDVADNRRLIDNALAWLAGDG